MSRTIPLCPIPRLSGGGPPVLAINWIEKGMGVVPTEFQVLVEQVVDAPELKEEIGKLVEAKRRGEELDRGPRIVPISEFSESELARLENKRFEREYHKPIAPVDEFNALFRSALDERQKVV
jgi:predicted nucleotidyltransferase